MSGKVYNSLALALAVKECALFALPFIVCYGGNNRIRYLDKQFSYSRAIWDLPFRVSTFPGSKRAYLNVDILNYSLHTRNRLYPTRRSLARLRRLYNTQGLAIEETVRLGTHSDDERHSHCAYTVRSRTFH